MLLLVFVSTWNDSMRMAAQSKFSTSNRDTFNSPQMPASPTGGQGLTQEALIEVLRNQRQNIVQQQNLIAGQGAKISELTKLVSGLVQMQTAN